MRLGQPALIRGVSIRSHRAQDQLEPQDGLFTVAVREPGEDMSLQVVGALTSVETGPAAALDALTAPATKLVTLTITEKGYEATADLPPSDVPTSVPALVALSLAQRRQAGVAPPVFASLDNLLDNGSMLRSRVLEAAERIDPSLAPWIARDVLFPSSVVDRMVPAPTERDLEEVADRLGLIDRAAVERGTTPLLDHPIGGRIGAAGRRRRGAGPGRSPLRASQALAPQRPTFGYCVRRPAGRS